MGFVEAIRTVLQNYVNFRGRASRPEFWWWTLLAFVINVAVSGSDRAVASLVTLAVAIPTIAVGVRRLHDTDRSGWFYLLTIIPLVNLIILYFFIQAGTPGSNRFGPPPATNRPAQRSAPVEGGGSGPGFTNGPHFGPEAGPDPSSGAGPGGWDTPPPRPPLLG
jgi:uncharacterized membrane protein YhaH (DUF805 family)